ncbi:hypothetical protein ACFL6T_06785, partial [Candidatus Zixiibacteriota bacterium]
DSPLSLDDIPDLETSIDMVEGLEIATPGGESIDIDQVEGLDETGDHSTDQDDSAAVGGGDGLVAGPLELPDEVLDAASEGIELDSSFEVMPVDDETVAGEDLTAVLDLSDEESGELDVDEALKALEAELDTDSDVDDGVGSLLEDDQPPAVEASAEIGLDVDEEETLDLDQALADLGGDDDIDAVAADEAVPDEAADESSPADIPAVSAGLLTTITSADDSVIAAIQAEILVGKGLFQESIRLYEALQIWEPDRESFRIRVEELRRMTQQPEEPE